MPWWRHGYPNPAASGIPLSVRQQLPLVPVNIMARHVLKKTLWVLLGLIAIFVVTALIGAWLLEDRLRAYVEEEANRRATDYVIQIKGLTLHPLRLSVDLHDVLVAHKRHPDPPIVAVQRVTAGVRWSSLPRARVIGDLLVDRPTVRVTR